MSKLEKITFTTELLNTQSSEDTLIKMTYSALFAPPRRVLHDRDNRVASAKFEEL